MAGLTLAELNEKFKETPQILPEIEVIPDGDIISEEEQLHLDIREAIKLLSESATVAMFVGNPEIVKTVTKRERAALRGLAKRINRFLDENVEYYFEKGELT